MSLRDEVAEAIRRDWDPDAMTAAEMADAALAVVRRHIEALPATAMLVSGPKWIARGDLLDLLDEDAP